MQFDIVEYGSAYFGFLEMQLLLKFPALIFMLTLQSFHLNFMFTP